MTLAPVLEADPALLVHVCAAALAILLGPVALYRRRRDRLHRILGRAWVAAMAALAVSSLWIPAGVLPLAGGFGPIHLLSAVVLVALARAVLAIRRRDVAAHAGIMRGLYWQALLLAGLFTLLPGRRLNAMLPVEAEQAGIWLIAAVAVIVAGRAAWLRTRRATA